MTKNGWIILAVLAGGVAAFSSCQKDAKPRVPRVKVTAVTPEALCATHGAVGSDGDRLRIDQPTVRAVATTSAGDAAAMHFTYGGATEESELLASGQLRRQLGLKLRAEDGCNLIYVMWRIDPDPGIEVSIKRNPGKHTHAECGTDGYTKIKPKRNRKVPTLEAGAAHQLQAEIRGDELIAWVDDRLVWSGRLGGAADGLGGPAGLRSDNVVLDLDLLVAPGAAKAPARCKPEESDE